MHNSNSDLEVDLFVQFGSQLTDDELQELSTGRLIQRLKLATNRPDGLDECTREMFSLAMLVRLGRITEGKTVLWDLLPSELRTFAIRLPHHRLEY